MVVPMGEVACLSGGVREKPRCQGHLVSTGLQAPVGPRGALSGPGKHLRPDLLSSRELAAQTQEKDKDSCCPYPSPLERRSLGELGPPRGRQEGQSPLGAKASSGGRGHASGVTPVGEARLPGVPVSSGLQNKVSSSGRHGFWLRNVSRSLLLLTSVM